MKTEGMVRENRGLGAAGWLPLVGVVLAAAGVVQGCTTLVYNEDYCAATNAGGNRYCLEKYQNGSQPFCISGTDTCVNQYALRHGAEDVQRKDFDGCVMTEPPRECYSPCGDRMTFDDERGCLEMAGTDNGTSGVTTTAMTSEASSEVSSSTGAFGSSSASTTSSSEQGTSGTSTDGIDTGNTGGTCAPLMGFNWQGCIDMSGQEDTTLCGATGATCFSRPLGWSSTFSACSANCDDDCPCPVPDDPAITAESTCDYLPDEDNERDCYLDCSLDPGGCPDNMECILGICIDTYIHVYGDCTDSDCGDGICVSPGVDGSGSNAHVCSMECVNETTCPDAPAETPPSITVQCENVDGETGKECYLDCTMNAEDCPSGMICLLDKSCAWPST